MSPRAYLFSLEQFGIKLGLEQIRRLLASLDHPETAFPSLIVAGTNGKGSVTAMVERGLRAAGLRTGRYTSPHLLDIEERFAIDGTTLAGAEFDRLAGRIERVARALPVPPSFFEATTALALEAFREAQVDVAVLEVGLGGRLDATNAVPAVAAAITAVDFDHEEHLGHTIEAIAREKAGVIKPGMVVVLGVNPPPVVQIVRETCAAHSATCIDVQEDTSADVRMRDGRAELTLTTPRRRYEPILLGLRGRHQVDNAVVAIRLLEELGARETFRIGAEAIRTAIEDVHWPGRLELVRYHATDVLIDGAHNPSGARALASYLAETYGRRLTVVLGVMRDKHADEMIAALAPVTREFVCTAAHSPRAEAPAQLAERAERIAPDVPRRAVVGARAALDAASADGDPVVVAGSLYLAGEIRAERS